MAEPKFQSLSQFDARYGYTLSEEERIEMAHNLSGFFSILHEWQTAADALPATNQETNSNDP